ncbi:hypothetical protein [Microvirga makkahensis]|uniref:Uncharacterized protein n=1 Tax=Microvirga makkahensis TaxID=1128670 RepID=A0A7X3SQ75_9HYPH|nr:hypothetical protein [Microvirga makkahensis]MXQ12874.1 hypothetical protein [Microvirga makkahensis]
MLLTSTRFGIVTGAAMLAAGIAFADSGISSLGSSLLRAAQIEDRAAPKGDRLMIARAAEDRMSVSIVEIVGLTHATVILRGDDGEVLYRSDPRSGMTTVSKNTEIPVLATNEEFRNPARQDTPATREGRDGPRKPKRKLPVGCMGDVSPLASASANRMPSLCLALLDRPLS